MAQYPATRTLRFQTQVFRFVDGSEQRFVEGGAELKRWEIEFRLLSESERGAIVDLFRDRGGAHGTFSFTDPWSGVEYPQCGFAADSLAILATGEGRTEARLVIEERRV
ncbi:MAG: DUF2460 domain-containing protein [Bryobacteraceae bacterium]|nr:DUF2460 domain-containing protein [Bryobacteraceae bacterium]